MEIVVQGPSPGSPSPISGICPHCKHNVVFANIPVAQLSDLHILPNYFLGHRVCPNSSCNKHIFFVSAGNDLVKVYPPPPVQQGRPPLSSLVPPAYSNEYYEAAQVIDVSPKASAALSRRCLQRLLREHLGIKKKDLSQEIDELLKTAELPSYLSSAVDAIRNIGNFAAHPLKYESTAEIVDVEPGEAEWLLDVLEMLFDFYFIQPEGAKSKKEALNKKLIALGKPPMK